MKKPHLHSTVTQLGVGTR